jgi:diguanylate cyclase (GGDEF)-like protein/PAS domain S-box-containing protein
MGLRARTLTIVAIVMVVLFGALLLVVRPLLDSAFVRLEEERAVIDGERLANAVREETRRLEGIVSSWASRNITFAYARGDGPGFEAEVTGDTMSQMGVNAFVIVDEDGSVLMARFADLDLGTITEVHESALAAILDVPALQRPNDPRASASGAIAFPGGAMLVASRSITTSDLYSVPEGTLIVARYIDGTEIAALADDTGLEVTGYLAEGEGQPAAAARLIEGFGSDESVGVATTDEEHMTISVLLRDLDGRPLMLLQQQTPRSVRAVGRTALLSAFIALLAVGAITTAAVGLVVDRSVLARVDDLSRDMAGITLRHDLSTRVEVRGRDEIASLATDINDALEAIEATEQELVSARDELELRVLERTEELHGSEERYRSLVDRLADGVFVLDSHGVVTFANRRAEELAERPLREILGARLVDLMSPASGEEVERRMAAGHSHLSGLTLEVMMGDASCGPAPVELRSVPLLDDSGLPSGTQWIARDIAERKRFESQLVYMANHDYLTGLFNRQFFESALDLELAESRRTGRGGAILWLDVDDFKEVNDTFGHRAGDEVLVGLAARLQAEIRESTVLSRLGGDEFAALLPDTSVEEAEAVASRLLGSINSHIYSASEHAVRLSASIGVVMYPTHGSTSGELLANADVAMYLAKASGRSCVHMHRVDGPLQDEMRARATWSERLMSAIDEERFRVYAQPVLDLRSGEIVRFELLIRMLVDGEVVLPAEFLPAAERLGFIRDIDRWMVGQAVTLLADGGIGGTSLEVNLSGRAFGDSELLGTIEDALRVSGVDPRRLGFEITETAAIADIAKAERFITTLKQLGCRFSLDDFGSGFSSFYYLKHLSIDCLKVDGSFIRSLPDCKQDQYLVRGIVELCRGLGVEIAVEYVENQETLEIVKGLGVDLAQGYHIGRPVPVEELLKEAGGVV